jgi:co-chaperonin GroES (HSP10)
VIVKCIEEKEQEDAGGIIMPGTAKEKPQQRKMMPVGSR